MSNLKNLQNLIALNSSNHNKSLSTLQAKYLPIYYAQYRTAKLSQQLPRYKKRAKVKPIHILVSIVLIGVAFMVSLQSVNS